jgi:hypothetical protein
MAYQSNWKDDQLAPGAAVPNQNTSGVVDGSTSVDPNAGGAAPTTQGTPGTGFVNLNSYLDANKGEGGRLATASTAGLTKQADDFSGEAKNTVTNAQPGFAAAAGGDKVGGIKAGLQADPTKGYGAAADFLGAGYTGPTADTAGAGLQADARTVSGNLAGVDAPGAAQVALQDAYGKTGNYTQGFGDLDSFLQQGDQSGRDVVAGVKGRAGEVNAEAGGAADQLKTAEATARQGLKDNQNGVVQAAGGVQTGILNRGAQSVIDKNKGIDRSYLGNANASLGDVLTDKDHSDLAALARLQGNDPNDPRWSAKTFNAGTAQAPAVIGGSADAAMVGTGKNALGQVGKVINGIPVFGSPAQQVAAAKTMAPALKAGVTQGAANIDKTVGPNAIATEANKLPAPPEVQAANAHAQDVVNSGVDKAKKKAHKIFG